MSLALIVLGALLVAAAVLNRLPFRPSRAVPASPASPPGRRHPHTAPIRLTEQGRATLTTIGGSMLIIAFFLALSGL
ncbi:hypothetical protein [Nocardiopsis ansamitocini]|uniref:Uncharacterized protein n=1 Tax=Nocardiopsis ansamitocini TaxID=1670832 RepID=A0A9W6P5Y1_9ACTN|nr:hypothetical protein [Nocardiopsis ansamitocini]GLU47653.1 hypothetical protein Nans01_20040 [Nocardiopsis ansamitocini]